MIAARLSDTVLASRVARTVEAPLEENLSDQREANEEDHEHAFDDEDEAVGDLEEEQHGDADLLNVHADNCTES